MCSDYVLQSAYIFMTSKYKMCLAALLLFIIQITYGVAIRSNYILTAEDEADLHVLLAQLYELLPELYDRTAAILSPDEVENLLDGELHEIFAALNETNTTRPSTSCLECRAFLTLMEGVVNKGSYEEIEDAFIDLCYVAVNASDDLGIPEYICPGIADNYLPHAVYVLNNTDMDTSEICLFWNECLYNDFDPPYPKNETLVCMPPPIPTSTKRSRKRLSRDLENSIRIAHLTDVHVNGWYDVGSPTQCGMPVCCSYNWTGEGFAGYWGDYNCNQPVRTNDVMFSYLATLSPHFVLYTGDNPPHTTWEDTYESQYSMSALVVDSFSRNLPGIRVLPALGNHDIHPTNLYFNERQEVKDGNLDLSLLWQDLAGFDSEQMETFQYAAYYTTVLQPGLRVIAYNSNYGWLENFYTLLRDRQPDYWKMREWMENTLEGARQNNEKVILMSHHITGQSQGNNEYSCFITDIHARYADIIVLHLSGHKHGDLFRLVRDIHSGETVGVQISSPAAGTKTDRNPSMRIFYLDPITFDVLDSDIYRVNMSKHIGDTDGSHVPVVDFGYRFTEEYNVKDMHPTSMEELVLRFSDDADLFDKYMYNYETANVDRIDECDEDCRVKEICQMMNTAYPGYLVCMDEI